MTDKKKKYDIVHKGVCSPQAESFVAAKQYLIINEDGKRYLLVKLTNNRAEHVTGATLFVEQFNDRGDKISAENVHVCGFDGFPQKSFAVEQKILVAPTCADCRITVVEAEFGKYTYSASDESGTAGYKFEPDEEPETKVPAEILEKAGKNGVTVEPRSLKKPTLILVISLIMLVVTFVSIWIYTKKFVETEEKFLHDGVYYSFVGDNRADGSDVYVVGVRGARTEISVPAEIDGHKVVRVDAGAFHGNKTIKKVSFGGEIAIGERAFFGCTALESIDLKNATDIASFAFSGCTSLRSVSLEKAFNIGDGAFNRCTALTSFTISDSGPEITVGNAAFSNCESLSTVDISRKIVYGMTHALFDNCLNVTSLHLKNFECGTVERSITALFGGKPALKSIIIDEIDTVCSGFCEGLSELTTVRLNSIVTPRIGERAFKACENLTEVITPIAVTRVADEAFSGTAITTFDGSELELLGDKAFHGCKSLVSFALFKDTKLSAIGEAAFYGCEQLKSITIPTEVTTIGEAAFYGCTELSTVSFDDESKIAGIANYAFENCERLSTINIPATVRTIGDNAFSGCSSLSALTLPDNLVVVGAGAFRDSGLNEIKLPATVTDIGFGAFYDCEKLRALTTPFVGGSREQNKYISYIFGAESADGALIVPAALKTVTVTNSTAAHDNAFYGCIGLTSVVYTGGILSVGENAFRSCSALTDVELADGLESIGVRAFADCAALTEITLPDTLTNIGRNAFSGCTSLQKLTTPFVGASRSSNGFLAYMFGGESPEDCDKVPASLKKVELTDTKTVGAGAFAGTAVAEVVLSESTTAISDGAFMNNRKLNMITLPNGLSEIGENAFFGCYFLYEIYNYSDLKLRAGASDYGYVAYYALKIHTADEPRLTVAGYNGYEFVRSDEKWYLVRYPDNEENLVLPAAVATEDVSFTEYAIHDRLFIDDIYISSVVIPSNAKSIGVEAFAGCESLTTINIENGVTSIGRAAFSGCGITAFSFPTGVATVADDLFSGCVELESIVMPTSVDRIGDSAFYDCLALKEIAVPTGCESIGAFAFGGCTSLLKVQLPDSCTAISDGAFGGCIMLYSVNIPSACQTIGAGAFIDCRRIKSVTLPETIERIGVSAFGGCIKLYEVYNFSGYVITPGTDNYGSVAKNAYAVHGSADEEPLDNIIISGLHYYKLSGKWYLVDYYGTDGNIDIGRFTFGTELVDDITVVDYAFRLYDNIKSIKIGKEVSHIGNFAFNTCKALISLEIAADKLTIAVGAFGECENLNSLVVLSGDVEFGSESFGDCGLKSISLKGGDFTIMDNVFFNNFELDTLSVDCKSLAVYELAFFDGLNKADIKCSDSFTAEYMAFFGSLISELNVQADDIVILDQNFHGSDLSEVNISGKDSVYISSTAFSACGNLATLDINGKTVEIEATAFSDCGDVESGTGIGELKIIGEQINIAESAFSSCVIESITIDGKEISLEASTFNESKIGKLAITCGGDIITVGSIFNSSTLAELAVRGKKVEITSKAFYATGSLASVDVTAENLKIEDSAFAQCASLKTIAISKGATSIGDNAFAYCTGLEELSLSDGLVSIGNSAFMNCNKLKSLTIPNSVTSVGASAFMSCGSLERLVISTALSEIAEFTFYNCEKLTEINLPSGITHVGQYAFFGCCNIKSLTIPNTVTKIDDYGFGGCSVMETLKLGGVLELGDGAFSGCSALKTLAVPNGVTEIPTRAFNGCTSLTVLTIPDSVTKIGAYAFASCQSLAVLTLPTNLEVIDIGAFLNCYALKKLIIPAGVKSISDDAFSNCYLLGELTLPNGLTAIGENAFYNCNALNSLALPSSLGYIGASAFGGCYVLAQLTVNTADTLVIGGSAFYGCNALTKLELKNIVTIGPSAFSDCFNLESVSISFKSSNSVERVIESEAFKNCYKLKTVDIAADANTNVKIYSSAFIGCGELTTLNLPSALSYIGASAFNGCAKLQYVELPAALTVIGNNAFYGATSLFAVCNKSELDIEVGSESNGGVAKYAVIVTDNPDKARLTYATSGANKYVRADGVWYLYESRIDASGYGLPESATTSAGVISSYVIKRGTFVNYISMIVIPKSVAAIQNGAFNVGANSVFYKGTADEWSEICGDMAYNRIYYYVDCVHGSGEWTEIDGNVSTDISMSTWTTVKPATCTDKGKRERRCSRCGATQEQEIPIDQNAHDYQNGVCVHCGKTSKSAVYTTDNEDGEQSIDD